MTMKHIQYSRFVSIALLLGAMVGVATSLNVLPSNVSAATVEITAETNPLSVTTITLEEDTTYNIANDVTYSTGNIAGGTNVLTKTGAGALKISGLGNSALTVQEGTVLLVGQSSGGSRLNANAPLTVLSGATVKLIENKDIFGWNAPSGGGKQRINLYGGTLLKEFGQNETFSEIDIHMRGGTLSATAGNYDILKNSVSIFVEAEEGATTETPTDSLIAAPLQFRNEEGNFTSAKGAEFNVAENARLTISGQMTTGRAEVMNLMKTGAGTLVVSHDANNFLGMTSVTAGELQVTGKLLDSPITVENGATLTLAKTGSAAKTITLNDGATLNVNAAGAAAGQVIYNPNATINYSEDGTLGGAFVIPTGVTWTLERSEKLTGGITVNEGATLVMPNLPADTPKLAGTITLHGTLTGTGQYKAGDTRYGSAGIIHVGADETLNVNTKFIAATTGNTLTKTGAGTLVFEQYGEHSSGTLVVEEGIVSFKQRDDHRHWNGDIIVKDGAVVDCAHDALGYATNRGTTNVYVEKGGLLRTLHGAGNNETFRNVSVFLQGGAMEGGEVCVLSTNVGFRSMALEDATPENPTVSTISNLLTIRTNLDNTDTFTFTTDENSVLDLTGGISIWNNSMPSNVGVHKAGAGTLIIRNENNTNVMDALDFKVDAGTLRVMGDSMNTAKSLTIHPGAKLEVVGENSVIKNLTIHPGAFLEVAEGTQVNGLLSFGGTQYLTVGESGTIDFMTVAGNVSFVDGANFELSSEIAWDYEKISELGPLTLMASTQEFTGIENVSLDVSPLNIELPGEAFWYVSQYSVDGQHYLSASIGLPEPATWGLLLLGIVGVFGLRRAKRG